MLPTALLGVGVGTVVSVGLGSSAHVAEWLATTGWHNEFRIALWLVLLGLVVPRPIAAARAGVSLLWVSVQGAVLATSAVAAGFWLTSAELHERDDAGFVVLGAACVWTVLARAWLADAVGARISRLQLIRRPDGGILLAWCRALALAAGRDGGSAFLRAPRFLGMVHARVRGFRWTPGARLVRAFEGSSASRLRARRRELDRSANPSAAGHEALSASLVAELRIASLRASLDRLDPRVFDARVRRIERAVAALVLGCSPRSTRDDQPLVDALDEVDEWSRLAVANHDAVSRLMALRPISALELMAQAARPRPDPGPWQSLERGLIALRLLEKDLPHWALDVATQGTAATGPVLRAVETLARETLADPGLALAAEDRGTRAAEERWCRAKVGARRGVVTAWSPESVEVEPHRPAPSVAFDHGRHFPGLVLVPAVALALGAIVWMATRTWPRASLVPALTDPLDAWSASASPTSVAALPGSGEVLFGTDGGGVRVVDGRDFSQRWEQVRQHPGLASDRVVGLAASSDEIAAAHVVGSGHGLSLRRHAGDWVNVILPVGVHDLDEASIQFAAVWEGQLVIATPEGGFLRYDSRRRALEPVPIDGELDRPLTSVGGDTKGVLWAAAGGRLFRLTRTGPRLRSEPDPSLADQEIVDLVAADGVLLARSSSGAVHLRADAGWELLLQGSVWPRVMRSPVAHAVQSRSGERLWLYVDGDQEGPGEFGVYDVRQRRFVVGTLPEGTLLGEEGRRPVVSPDGSWAVVALSEGGVARLGGLEGAVSAVPLEAFQDDRIRRIRSGVSHLTVVAERDLPTGSQQRVSSMRWDDLARGPSAAADILRLGSPWVAEGEKVVGQLKGDARSFLLATDLGELVLYDTRFRTFADRWRLEGGPWTAVTSADTKLLALDRDGALSIADRPLRSAKDAEITSIPLGPRGRMPEGFEMVGAVGRSNGFALVGPDGAVVEYDFETGWSSSATVITPGPWSVMADGAWLARSPGGDLLTSSSPNWTAPGIGSGVDRVGAGIGRVPVSREGAWSLIESSGGGPLIENDLLPVVDAGLRGVISDVETDDTGSVLWVADEAGVARYTFASRSWQRSSPRGGPPYFLQRHAGGVFVHSESGGELCWIEPAEKLDEVRLVETDVARWAVGPQGLLVLTRSGEVHWRADAADASPAEQFAVVSEGVDFDGVQSAAVEGEGVLLVDPEGRLHRYEPGPGELQGVSGSWVAGSARQVAAGDRSIAVVDSAGGLHLSSSSKAPFESAVLPDGHQAVAVVLADDERPTVLTDRRGLVLASSELTATRVLAGGTNPEAEVGSWRAGAVSGDHIWVAGLGGLARRGLDSRRFERVAFPSQWGSPLGFAPLGAELLVQTERMWCTAVNGRLLPLAGEGWSRPFDAAPGVLALDERGTLMRRTGSAWEPVLFEVVGETSGAAIKRAGSYGTTSFVLGLEDGAVDIYDVQARSLRSVLAATGQSVTRLEVLPTDRVGVLRGQEWTSIDLGAASGRPRRLDGIGQLERLRDEVFLLGLEGGISVDGDEELREVLPDLTAGTEPRALRGFVADASGEIAHAGNGEVLTRAPGQREFQSRGAAEEVLPRREGPPVLVAPDGSAKVAGGRALPPGRARGDGQEVLLQSEEKLLRVAGDRLESVVQLPSAERPPADLRMDSLGGTASSVFAVSPSTGLWSYGVHSGAWKLVLPGKGAEAVLVGASDFEWVGVVGADWITPRTRASSRVPMLGRPVRLGDSEWSYLTPDRSVSAISRSAERVVYRPTPFVDPGASIGQALEIGTVGVVIPIGRSNVLFPADGGRPRKLDGPGLPGDLVVIDRADAAAAWFESEGLLWRCDASGAGVFDPSLRVLGVEGRSVYLTDARDGLHLLAEGSARTNVVLQSKPGADAPRRTKVWSNGALELAVSDGELLTRRLAAPGTSWSSAPTGLRRLDAVWGRGTQLALSGLDSEMRPSVEWIDVAGTPKAMDEADRRAMLSEALGVSVPSWQADQVHVDPASGLVCWMEEDRLVAVSSRDEPLRSLSSPALEPIILERPKVEIDPDGVVRLAVGMSVESLQRLAAQQPADATAHAARTVVVPLELGDRIAEVVEVAQGHLVFGVTSMGVVASLFRGDAFGPMSGVEDDAERYALLEQYGGLIGPPRVTPAGFRLVASRGALGWQRAGDGAVLQSALPGGTLVVDGGLFVLGGSVWRMTAGKPVLELDLETHPAATPIAGTSDYLLRLESGQRMVVGPAPGGGFGIAAENALRGAGRLELLGPSGDRIAVSTQDLALLQDAELALEGDGVGIRLASGVRIAASGADRLSGRGLGRMRGFEEFDSELVAASGTTRRDRITGYLWTPDGPALTTSAGDHFVVEDSPLRLRPVERIRSTDALRSAPRLRGSKVVSVEGRLGCEFGERVSPRLDLASGCLESELPQALGQDTEGRPLVVMSDGSSRPFAAVREDPGARRPWQVPSQVTNVLDADLDVQSGRLLWKPGRAADWIALGSPIQLATGPFYADRVIDFLPHGSGALVRSGTVVWKWTSSGRVPVLTPEGAPVLGGSLSLWRGEGGAQAVLTGPGGSYRVAQDLALELPAGQEMASTPLGFAGSWRGLHWVPFDDSCSLEVIAAGERWRTRLRGTVLEHEIPFGLAVHDAAMWVQVGAGLELPLTDLEQRRTDRLRPRSLAIVEPPRSEISLASSTLSLRFRPEFRDYEFVAGGAEERSLTRSDSDGRLMIDRVFQVSGAGRTIVCSTPAGVQRLDLGRPGKVEFLPPLPGPPDGIHVSERQSVQASIGSSVWELAEDGWRPLVLEDSAFAFHRRSCAQVGDQGAWRIAPGASEGWSLQHRVGKDSWEPAAWDEGLMALLLDVVDTSDPEPIRIDPKAGVAWLTRAGWRAGQTVPESIPLAQVPPMRDVVVPIGGSGFALDQGPASGPALIPPVLDGAASDQRLPLQARAGRLLHDRVRGVVWHESSGRYALASEMGIRVFEPDGDPTVSRFVPAGMGAAPDREIECATNGDVAVRTGEGIWQLLRPDLTLVSSAGDGLRFETALEARARSLPGSTFSWELRDGWAQFTWPVDSGVIRPELTALGFDLDRPDDVGCSDAAYLLVGGRVYTAAQPELGMLGLVPVVGVVSGERFEVLAGPERQPAFVVTRADGQRASISGGRIEGIASLLESEPHAHLMRRGTQIAAAGGGEIEWVGVAGSDLRTPPRSTVRMKTTAGRFVADIGVSLPAEDASGGDLVVGTPGGLALRDPAGGAILDWLPGPAVSSIRRPSPSRFALEMAGGWMQFDAEQRQVLGGADSTPSALVLDESEDRRICWSPGQRVGLSVSLLLGDGAELPLEDPLDAAGMIQGDRILDAWRDDSVVHTVRQQGVSVERLDEASGLSAGPIARPAVDARPLEEDADGLFVQTASGWVGVRYDEAAGQLWMTLDADVAAWTPAEAAAAASTDAWLTRADDFRWRLDPAGRFSAEVRRLGSSSGEEQWVSVGLSQGGFDHDICSQILGVGAVPFVLTSRGALDPAALRSRNLVATGLEDQLAKGSLIARSDRSERPHLLSPATQSLVQWDGASRLFSAVEWPTDPAALVSVLVDEDGWRLFRDHLDGLHLSWEQSEIAVGPGRVFLDGQFSFDRVVGVLGGDAGLQVWTGSRVEIYRGSATVPVAVMDYPSLDGALAFGWSTGRRTVEMGGRRFVIVDNGFVDHSAESPDGVVSAIRIEVGSGGLRAVLKARDAVLELELLGSGHEHRVADVLGVAQSGSKLWLAGRDGVRWLRLEPRWLDRLGSAPR